MEKWISFWRQITLIYFVRKFWPLYKGDCPKGILNWFYLSFSTLSVAKPRNQANLNCELYCPDRKTTAQLWSRYTASCHSLLHLVVSVDVINSVWDINLCRWNSCNILCELNINIILTQFRRFYLPSQMKISWSLHESVLLILCPCCYA